MDLNKNQNNSCFMTHNVLMTHVVNRAVKKINRPVKILNRQKNGYKSPCVNYAVIMIIVIKWNASPD